MPSPGAEVRTLPRHIDSAMSPIIQALPREVGAPYLSSRVVPLPTVLIVADRTAHCTQLATIGDQSSSARGISQH